MLRSGIKVVSLAGGPLVLGFLPYAWNWRCRVAGRNRSPTRCPPFLRQWPAGRLWIAPPSQLMSRRSTVRSAMGASTAPRGSGLDKAPAASALTRANTWASSSKSELLPHCSHPRKAPVIRTAHYVPIATFSGSGRMDSIVDWSTIRILGLTKF